MTLLNRIIFAALAFTGMLGAQAPEILPLSEIEPGMEGEFRTVIEGTEIQSFPIRIVGVVENFIGPQRPVIWAEALDSDNRLFGPVSGMSGSPVYIGGKLIGAYAYGYTFPKDQALIGIQPIESMLEISELHPPQTPSLGAPRPSPLDRDARRQFLSSDGSGLAEVVPPGEWQWSKGNPPDGASPTLSAFRPLPVPLMMGGFSPQTLAVFAPQFRELGIDVMQAPVGGGSSVIPGEIEPGSPVAGVLMTGDFNAAGVGTVTFRDGERILAFGHPFFQYGPTEIPMASAEVVTIVQSVASSFKLSNVGPIVGSIYQDRLTGIVGSIGRMAPTTALDIRVAAPGGVKRSYSGEIFQHRNLTPVLTAMAIMESLFSTLESENEQTIYMEMQLQVRDREPIRFRDVASGSGGPMRMVFDFLSIYDALMQNPFAFPEIESVGVEIELKDSWNQQQLEQVVVESGFAEAGKDLKLQVILRDYLGEPISRSVTIPIPEGTDGEILEVEIMDATRVNRNWGNGSSQTRYEPRPDARSLDDLLADLKGRRGFQAVYCKLIRRSDGVRMRGRDLEDLPPSIIAAISSPKTAEVMQRASETTLWEGAFPTSGEFRGYYRFRVEVLD